MNVKMTRSTILVIVVLATANSLPVYFATTPAFAQPTTGTPSPSTAPGGGTTTGDFAEFMQCLDAAGPSPSEEQVTACYDPIYGGGAGDEEGADEGGGDTEGGGDSEGGGDTEGGESEGGE